MAIGTSIFLLAVGAVLTWAVDARLEGVDLNAVGIILMVIGAIGVFASLIWADTLSSRRETIVHRDETDRVL